jgi:hypothetical protein
MARTKIGKLRPRYSFLLNPYSDVRLSKCPKCDKLTHPRKFALLIHVEGWDPLVLGKTCRYCSRCELIIAHQDELEAELAHAFNRLAPEVVGKDYLVLGTMDKKAWRKGLEGSRPQLGDALDHVADFKKFLELHVEGGWRPAKK